MNFELQAIGLIHTPYTLEKGNAPFQSSLKESSDCSIEIFPEHTERLEDLDSFRYMYVLYWLDKARKPVKTKVSPPWVKDKTIGLFASRSPNRINPIGLSVLRIDHIQKNRIVTSNIDAFDKTPVIDIKPYIKDIDVKIDANNGWIDHSERKISRS